MILLISIRCIEAEDLAWNVESWRGMRWEAVACDEDFSGCDEGFLGCDGEGSGGVKALFNKINR